MCCAVSFVCQSIGEVPPPLPYTLQTIVLLLFTSSIFKDTLYFLLKYVLPPVLFTLTQVVLLLITSTFTQVQIQSNLGTTEYNEHEHEHEHELVVRAQQPSLCGSVIQ